MAAEVRLNADGATLTIDEMESFTSQARKLGGDPTEQIQVGVVEGVVTFSVGVRVVHRALTECLTRHKEPVMRGARRSKR